MEKKFVSILILLCLTFGFITAEEPGFEVGIGYDTKIITFFVPNGFIVPNVSYNNTLGNFDLMLDLRLFFFGGDASNALWGLNTDLAYNFPLNSGIFSIIFSNESVNGFGGDSDFSIGLMFPGLMYSTDISSGKIFGKLGVLYFYGDGEMGGIYGSFGFEGNRFGAEFMPGFTPDSGIGFFYLNLLLNYKTDRFFAGLTITNYAGLYTIFSPEVKFFISDFTIWARGYFVFNEDDSAFFPGLGVSYRF